VIFGAYKLSKGCVWAWCRCLGTYYSPKTTTPSPTLAGLGVDSVFPTNQLYSNSAKRLAHPWIHTDARESVTGHLYLYDSLSHVTTHVEIRRQSSVTVTHLCLCACLSQLLSTLCCDISCPSLCDLDLSHKL